MSTGLLATVLLSLSAASEAGPVPREIAPRLTRATLGIADAHDVVFLGEGQAVWLRLHLETAGESLADRWAKQLRKYFDFLDRDGNGSLSPAEAEFALANTGVVSMIMSGFGYQRPPDAVQAFAEFDLNKDGRVAFDEFAKYYAPSAQEIVGRHPHERPDPVSVSLTDELFKLLDTNRDGRLARREVEAIGNRLASHDTDEDDCLSPLELVPGLGQARNTMVLQGDTANPAAPTIAFTAGAWPDTLVKAIVSRYDKDRNGLLTRTESPLDPETFSSLDRNRDGQLIINELAGWRSIGPDLELDLVLADRGQPQRVRVRRKRKQGAISVQAAVDGTASVAVGTQRIQVSCYAPTGVYVPASPTNLPFPDDGTGFVTEKQIVGPQFQALRVLFDTIDRNADGKLSRAEFDAFKALQSSFTALPLALVYSAPTPSLFELLDTNGDGRLSTLEMKNAWSALIVREPTERNFVTRSALQPQGAIRFGRLNEVTAFNPADAYFRSSPRSATRGPLWYRKFDRNGDGVVTRKEFPGKPEDFDRLDTNQDGYISVEEAEVGSSKK